MKKLSLSLLCLVIVLLAFSAAHAEQSMLRILYVNDFHGFAEPHKPFGSDEVLGGIAYLSSRVNALRSEKPSILLAAGDMIQGHNWATMTTGASVIELMNLMRFDAMVVGNHEFDFGQDVLRKRIAEAEFPVLGANIQGLDALRPYIIKDIGGIKAGIIGVVTEETPVTTHPRNVTGLTFLPQETTLTRYIQEISSGTDVIIVLSHIGHQADRVLAEHIEGIDIIVGGHSHTRIDSPVLAGKTILLQAWEHAKALGVIDITMEYGKIVKSEGHLEIISPEPGTEDRDVSLLVEKYRKKIDAVLSETIGETDVDLDGENVRRRETNLGNLIADIMRETSGADMALINGGGIRTSIGKGALTVQNIFSVLPFDNYLVAVRLSGKQIKGALEHGVSAIEEGAGRFPQVSGISFSYVRSAQPGSRVRDVIIRGKQMEPDREYHVATNDFLAAGGDGYSAFGEALKSSKDFSLVGGVMTGEKLVYNDSSRWIRDVVIEYVKEKRRISPVTEGRIREIP